MTGCIIKRKLKSGIAWGYSFFAGRDEWGKRMQVFKSGFPTKRAAQDACKAAIEEVNASHGKVTREVATRGRRVWAFRLGDSGESGFTNKSAAENALRKAIDERDTEQRRQVDEKKAQQDLTFARYFQIWIEEHAARRCSPKTVERYRELGKYLIVRLGETPLNELTTAQIQRVIHELEDRGGAVTKEHSNGRPLAAKTVRHIGTLLYTALSEADRLGYLKIPHPMANKRVRLPKLPRRRPAILDPDRLRELFDCARGTRLYPFIIMAAATGCRRGELCAVRWQDQNFTTGELTVSRSLEQTKVGLRIKGTKSEEVRTFSVPEWALEVLEQHRVEQDRDRALFGPNYENNDLIFCQPGGAYYSPDRVGARVVELMRKAGLKGVSLHSLRHSHASSLLSKGVPIAVVSERLGHADQNITLSIYSHAMPADTRAAAKVWNDAMVSVIESARRPGPTRMLADVSRKAPRKIQAVASTSG